MFGPLLIYSLYDLAGSSDEDFYLMLDSVINTLLDLKGLSCILILKGNLSERIATVPVYLFLKLFGFLLYLLEPLMDLIDLLLNPGGSSVGSVGPPQESRRISVHCLEQ
jgi:hypothetical protein